MLINPTISAGDVKKSAGDITACDITISRHFVGFYF